LLEKTFEAIEYESKQIIQDEKGGENNYKFEITKGESDWKFEFVISKGKNRLIRAKIYCKTIYCLSSTGVRNSN